MQYVRLTISACMRIEPDRVCALNPGQDLVVLAASTVSTSILQKNRTIHREVFERELILGFQYFIFVAKPHSRIDPPYTTPAERKMNTHIYGVEMYCFLITSYVKNKVVGRGMQTFTYFHQYIKVN